MVVRVLERVLGLIIKLYMFNKKLILVEEREIIKCEEYFGFFKIDIVNEKRYFCKFGGRFFLVYLKIIENDIFNMEVMINIFDVYKEIWWFLFNECVKLIKMIYVMLEKMLVRNNMCMNEGMGIMCSDLSCEN